ncbi:MAG: hypothetical protein ACXWM8_05525, partial [Candidatus Limnocylindrales bacterium]
MRSHASGGDLGQLLGCQGDLRGRAGGGGPGTASTVRGPAAAIAVEMAGAGRSFGASLLGPWGAVRDWRALGSATTLAGAAISIRTSIRASALAPGGSGTAVAVPAEVAVMARPLPAVGTRGRKRNLGRRLTL